MNAPSKKATATKTKAAAAPAAAEQTTAWPFPKTGIEAIAAQLEKTATKTAVAVKPKAKQATAQTKVAVKPFKSQINFIVKGSGATKLFAHTAAWLELSGMIYGGEFPLPLVKKLGGTAASYHIKQGNMSVSSDMVRLTAKGLAKFQDRENGESQGFDHNDKEDYKLMMIHGLNDERLVKNESYIEALQPAK